MGNLIKRWCGTTFSQEQQRARLWVRALVQPLNSAFLAGESSTRKLINCCRIASNFVDDRSSFTDLSSGDCPVCPPATGLCEKESGGVSRTGVNRGCTGEMIEISSLFCMQKPLSSSSGFTWRKIKHFKHIWICWTSMINLLLKKIFCFETENFLLDKLKSVSISEWWVEFNKWFNVERDSDF